MHAECAAQKTANEIRAKKAKMATVDKQVLQTTLMSCSTGTKAEDKALAQQAELFGYRGGTGEPTGAWGLGLILLSQSLSC
jgi:hypothetical protein